MINYLVEPMSKNFVTLLLFCLSFAVQASPELTMSAEEQSAATEAERTGRAMFLHDRAAWVATDAMLAAYPKAPETAGGGGWITEESGADIIVTFYNRTPAAVYRITVAENGKVTGKVEEYTAPVALTPFEAGAAAAREVLSTASFDTCSKTYNTVVLPAADKQAGHWRGYLLPGTTVRGLVPIGGAHRFNIEGSAITARRSFTKSCLNLQDSANTKALYVTHLLDPTPTELHVFISLQTRKPLMMRTMSNGTAWLIAGGKISVMERPSPSTK
jgi:hypothetical protein